MYTYFRHSILIILLLILTGCSTCQGSCSESCAERSCSESCPECPCDPCAIRCPRPKDCGPTVAQLNRKEQKLCGFGTGPDLTFELRKQGIQIIEIGQNAIIILPADRFFEVNCATIREDAYCLLNCLVYFLNCYGCVPLYISGHTDNVAPNCYNLRISDARAQNIQAYLWIRGIQFRRMCSTGCGNCVPIANQVTVAGNAANRRIEIRVRRTGCFA